MTVKGLVTMVAAPMFSARTTKAQRTPLHVEWLPIHLPDKWRRYWADVEGDVCTDTGGVIGGDVGDQETDDLEERDWVQAGAAHIDCMGESLVRIEASKWKVSCENIRNKQGRPILLLGSDGSAISEDVHGAVAT